MRVRKQIRFRFNKAQILKLVISILMKFKSLKLFYMKLTTGKVPDRNTIKFKVEEKFYLEIKKNKVYLNTLTCPIFNCNSLS